MDSTSIYYKNMVDAMTYDGNMIFGHDNRHPSPVSIDIPAKGWWWAKYFKNRDLGTGIWRIDVSTPMKSMFLMIT